MTDAPDRPVDDGEMARRVAAYDWAATPLGPRAAWSDRLSTMVEQVLATPLLASLVCGPERILIYNDTAARLYGARHPAALGRPLPEVFPEGWETVAPFYARAFAGESVAVSGQPLDTRGEGDPGADVFDAYLTPVRENHAIAHVHMVGMEIGTRVRAETARRESAETLAADLADANLLRDLADRLVTEDTIETIYEEILSAAISITLADAGTVQVYETATKSLRLLVTRGFERRMTDHFDRVSADSHTACGAALRTAKRTFMDFDDETDEACVMHVDAGYRSAQATPLVSRSGAPLGMLNTHWREARHRPTDRQLWLLDLLARQTADLIEQRQAQAALKASEKRFRALVTAGSVSIYRMGPDWRTMYRLDSKDFLEPAGEPTDDWRERYILPEDRALVDDAIDRAIRTGSTFELEHRVGLADGGTGWVASRAVPVRGPDGAIVEWFGSGSDITARKQAQEALRESDERQAFLLKLSDALRPLDEPAAIQDVAARILGEHLGADRAYYVELDEALQIATVKQEYRRTRAAGSLASLVGVHDYAAFGATLDLLRKGKAVVFDDVETEPKVRPSHLPAYRALELRAFLNTPLVKGGTLVCAMCVVSATPRCWSMTEVALVEATAERTWAAVERAGAEAALRQSEERFRQFAASSSDALWIRDAASLAMEYASPAIQEIYGIAPAALLGDPARWTAMILPEDRATAAEHIEQARRGESVVHEFRIVRPSDGEERWIRNTDFPLRDALGRVERIGGIAEDVTDDKSASKRLEVLVNELQHRSRNLLAVITAVAHRTIGQGGSVAAFEARLQALSRAQGLLSQQGSDTVELGALVQAELAAHADKASRGVTVSGPRVHLTARQVQNFALALHELTTNAVKYGALKGEAGTLSVTWTRGEDAKQRPRLVLDWIESGVDVPPESVTRRGAGTELIENALTYALRAKTAFAITGDGARCRIELPLG